MGKYKHDTLDLNKSQIRLIRVLETRSGISCAVETFDLASCPPYEALSYVWGGDLSSHSILLNGQSYRIGGNLCAFFEHIHTSGIEIVHSSVYRSGYLWIDQISIDQTSVAEKSQQVQRMAQIYQDAQRCIVWLGPAPALTSDAITIIADICDMVGDDLTAVSDSNLRIVADICNNGPSTPGGLIDMLTRPYWLRVWTVQEFWLSSNLLLVMGHRAVDWRMLSKFWGVYELAEQYAQRQAAIELNPEGEPGASSRVLKSTAAASLIAHKHSTESWNYLSSNDKHASTNSWSLASAIHYFHDLASSDLRDRIYGLLGIVTEAERIDVDYSKSAPEVYWHALEAVQARSEISNEYWERLYGLGRDMGVSTVDLLKFRMQHRPTYA